ncbi:MAG: hypothetical protein EDX89_18110 [Acidobacteria bacterium]|nr:MAG: hypothetical protein EDX89_18110 [Acidobacteriota bacterium]MCE7957406.1 hypothetical protein [Acidobacteria bacterium ACB2]
MKRIVPTLALALVAALVATEGSAVSPPQYRQQRVIRGSVGASPLVSVGEVVETSGAYRVDVACASLEVARGVSFLLRKDYDFGGLVLRVRVLDERGNVVEVDESGITGDPVEASREYLSAALDGNPLFDSLSAGFFAPVTVLVRPEVVQFWNDNLADPHGNESLLAAEAFAECARESFLGGSVRPVWTTAPAAPRGGDLSGFVPAVVRSPGLFGSLWTTDLLLFGEPGTHVVLWFHAAGKDNTGAVPVPLTLAGGLTSVPDVLDALFHANGHGALRFEADRPVRLSARTSTGVPGGTTGLFTPGLPLQAAALGGTATATLQLGVDQHPGFRANLGLVNATPRTVDLLVEVTLGDGSPAPGFAPFPVTLPPYGMTQEADLLARLAPGERRGLLVRVRVLTAGGAAFAFLSEIDNGTNSPFYQPAVVR